MEDALKKLACTLRPSRLETETDVDKYVEKIMTGLREVINKTVL